MTALSVLHQPLFIQLWLLPAWIIPGIAARWAFSSSPW
jgi:hypothetical protein